MQLTDIECDEEDFEAYIEKEKDKKTLPIKTQCAILAHWNPYEQYVLPMIKKEFDDYYVAYLGIP